MIMKGKTTRMYKSLIFLFLVGIVSVSADTRRFKAQSNHIRRVTNPIDQGNNGIDWCPQCINTCDQLIEVILNIILEGGVVDTCGHLCDLVTKETGSGLLGFICDMGCDFVGLEEFVKLINEADIDPIYYCEKINLCPINDNGDCKFSSFNIVPQRAQTQSTISINMVYTTMNGTGTGELLLAIQTVDKIPLSVGFLNEAKKPGSYSERLSIDTTADPDCDPTTSECELWLEGTYNVTVMLCNGQCGAHHPHTSVYDIGHGSFTLYEE